MKLKEFIVLLEGKRNRIYPDSAGLPTIGIGHLLTENELKRMKIKLNGQDVVIMHGLSDDDINALFEQDIAPCILDVETLVKVPLFEHRKIALTSFRFNVGPHYFKESTLLKLVNSGKYDSIPNELKKWVYSGRPKKIDKILVNRRKKECDMWSGKFNEREFGG